MGTNPTRANVIAVQASEMPVKRVPYRSAMTPNSGCEMAAVPLYARLINPTVAKFRSNRPISTG